MSDKRRQPAKPTFSQDSGKAGKSRDGNAVKTDSSALEGFRRYRRAIGRLRVAAMTVESAATRATTRARELAEAVGNDEPGLSELAVNRRLAPTLPCWHSYGTSIFDDLDAITTATAELLDAVTDMTGLSGISEG